MITVGSKMLKISMAVHRNCENLEFQPGGPPDLKKKRRVLRTTYLLLRSYAPKCLKMMPETPGDHQKSPKIPNFELTEIAHV